MISKLIKHQQFIAVILFSISWAELLLPLTAHAGTEMPFHFSGGFSGDDTLRLKSGGTVNTGIWDSNNQYHRRTVDHLKRIAQVDDIGGPGQPEMSSFSSVNSSNMVDLFTGDFSYNLPLMDVGGYPVNIHYNSGISMDQEASWVGLGWNVNPGTIGRTTRGLPDDFNGVDSITRTQNIKANKTAGANLGAGVEIAGFVGVGGHIGVFHNNYNGWGTENGINVGITVGSSAKGSLIGSLGIGVSNNSQTGLSVSPSLSVNIGSKDAMMNGSATIGSNYNSRTGVSGLQLHTEVRANIARYDECGEERLKNNHGNDAEKYHTSGTGIGSFMSFATPSYLPTITMPITNSSYTFKVQVGSEVWALHPNAYLEGYVSKQYISAEDMVQKLPAYGYLNFSKATQAKVLLDFNREKDVPFNAKSSPHIAIPQYSYDTYSITGEGTGGMFRPYRGDVGFIFDHSVRTKSEQQSALGDLGFGAGFHVGVDIVPVTTTTSTGAWKSENDILKNIGFAKSDTTFQEVYFRNPGEKAINTSSFYSQLGGDSLIRVKLGGSNGAVRGLSTFTKFSQAKPVGDIVVNNLLVKQQRDKRTQVISYLNATDASVYGLDRNIKSYDTNSNPVTGCDSSFTIIPRVDGLVRKGHHLSEMKVLNGDGRIYIYGLPVYNVEQRDVTFAVAKEDSSSLINKGLVHYTPGDNTTSNQRGKDNYFTKDSTPAYAHSFLLTGLLSPDYVDIKGDGITDDDLGDAVKFNYTRLYGANNGYYGWRTPADSNRANYNEGLKTYSRDDKGTYMCGKKEVWYMHSIESKTMIALFKTSDRTDAMSVLGENGGYDNTKKLKQLDSIELYTKADLVKSGSTARPVKTVHFEYSYELCQNATGAGTGGKLTLKKIWFTYNGNNKGKLNPYQFYYHPDTNNQPLAESNPSYNAKTYDRWGNYKDPASNPGGLNNIDYPYAVQDSLKSATYSSAWHLTDVKLPSGGRMHVTFEGDDYAYVQNKRATQFFPIAGFGVTSQTIPQKFLYMPDATDCYYVFADVTNPVENPAEVYNKYLEGIEKIYFKVAVKMPTDQWGSGYEFVPTYGEIESYGVVTGNKYRFWIKLKPVANGSPITQAAIQFLRLNLPSKAYPTSELGDNFDFAAAIKMLGSSFTEIKNAVDGFYVAAKTRQWCNEAVTNASFIRLDNPDYKKYGGGVRVKRVEVYDNWKNMTTRSGSAGLKESVYGQDYTYTTTKKINGTNVTISSGVASYEPMIGGEENPFHTPIEYGEQVAPLAPTNYLYTETPMGESFFPSAMVGYSKVRTRTINKKAKSANGWDETEFFTTKDFPTRVEFTPFDGDSRKPYNPRLKNLLKLNAKNYITVSQGFKIELNDMNGKVKSQSSYKETDSLNSIHYVENFYKTDNDRAFQKHLSNTVWAADSASGHINTKAEIGREVEIMVDARQQQSKTTTSNLAANADVIIPFVPPFIPVMVLTSAFKYPQKEDDRFRSIAVTKIVQRYGILDSIVVRDKGSVVSTKNLVFDGETGNVLVTRTNNEFNDPVYGFNYPAHWAYSGMGLAYKNIDASFNLKMITDGRLTERDGTTFPAEKYFEGGDEIIALGTKRTGQAAPANGNDCPTDLFDGPIVPVRLWAMDAAKGKEKDRGIYFIDSLGRAYSGRVETMKIFRSGKRNFTDASVGSILSLANPVREVTAGEFRIVIDSVTKVINTTAATFKDLWKVENSLYQTDSCVTKVSAGQSYNVPLINTMTVRSTNHANTFLNPAPYNPMLRGQIVASYSKNGTTENLSRALLKFDFSSIPANATITSAKINFHGSKPGAIWRYAPWGNNSIDYSYEGIREAFDGHLMSYPFQWDGVSTPPFWEWYYNYKAPGLAKGILPYQGEIKSCQDFTNIECGTVIQDVIRKPANSQNLILKINSETYTGGGSGEIRFMSFCGNPSGNSITGMPQPCSNCIPVSLNIDYTYTKDTCYKVCRNNINDTSVNPYRWGILGNWRPDRSYTYYYDRKESDAGVTTTNIRREGELKDFIPYWQLNVDSLRAATDSSRWVWNSASSLYNRKGFEIENYDPLNRYNSGLYGYNQTLPVAVAQNSKYREILFDGFEDYGYKAVTCSVQCETPREIDFLKGNSSAAINDLISHSGRYSLSVTASSQAVFTAPVTKDTVLVPAVSANVDSTPVYDTRIIGKGTGLSATYRCVGVPGTPLTRTEGPINFTYYNTTLPVCVSNDPRTDRSRGYQATWSGKIQPRFTDNYTFYVNSSLSGAGIKIGSQVILTQSSGSNDTRASASIHLDAGKLYDIMIDYPSFTKRAGNIDVSWSSSQYQVKQIIPKENLYPTTITTSDTAGSVQKNILKYCVQLNKVKPENIIKPVFSPVQNSRMVASVWISTNTADCNNPDNPVPEGQAIISFEGSSATVTLSKTGAAIEGWQRYESFIDVPVSATKLYVTFKSDNSNTTYFDDIRVHPYNSNMKSFVYDPVSLRLMAELDENNYASFYEYDDDGTLIRVKKETERGIKTIKESRSALFKEE